MTSLPEGVRGGRLRQPGAASLILMSLSALTESVGQAAEMRTREQVQAWSGDDESLHKSRGTRPEHLHNVSEYYPVMSHDTEDVMKCGQSLRRTFTSTLVLSSLGSPLGLLSYWTNQEPDVVSSCHDTRVLILIPKPKPVLFILYLEECKLLFAVLSKVPSSHT